MRTGRFLRRERDPKLERLGRAHLFSECNRSELSKIAALTVEIEVPAGRVLMTEGDPGSEAFVIMEGRASVAIGGESRTTLEPGSCFGEMVLLEERSRRSATVTAETDMKLAVLSSREFSSLMQDAPHAAGKVLDAVRTRRADAEQVQPHG